MQVEHLLEENRLEKIVKDIFVLENEDPSKQIILPFYADGFPGIMYQKTAESAVLLSSKKKLSDFFLYGQTIKPIEIAVSGAYRLIVFQLYPYASRLLFGVNPQKLNDECYDLQMVEGANAEMTIERLKKAENVNDEINSIIEFIKKLYEKPVKASESKVELAIDLIIRENGKITVKALTEQLFMTERTLQRQFIEYIGIPPKKFASIVQFQTSISQISAEAVSRLTDIVYENGYTDQSHFIRSFKKYAGKKPTDFKKSG